MLMWTLQMGKLLSTQMYQPAVFAELGLLVGDVQQALGAPERPCPFTVSRTDPASALATKQNGDIDPAVLCQPAGAAQLCPAENAEPCGPSASQGTTSALGEAQTALLRPHSWR